MSFFDENLAPSVTQETDAALVSLGQRGCVCLYGETTSSASGNFAAIQCITDTVFNFLETIEGSGAASPFSVFVDESLTVPAGTIIYGRFTYVEVGGGDVAICYKA